MFAGVAPLSERLQRHGNGISKVFKRESKS